MTVAVARVCLDPGQRMPPIPPGQIEAVALSLTLQLQLQRSSANASPSISSGESYTESDARRLADRFRRAQQRPEDAGLQRLLTSIRHVAEEIDGYESPVLQEQALDNIPFDVLHDRAAALHAETPDLAFQDCLAQSLVEWAKSTFLRWVDPIRCSICHGETEGIGVARPSDKERIEGGAGRVEVYRCLRASCNGQTERFPRYSRLDRLLETRTGRCGEFAAVFMLLLRALSFRARYVWNSEDHVWNEYYSEQLQRWVHVDSCEGARDKNLLYDKGWGKKMKYCIAVGLEGAVDVTRTYVANWDETKASRNMKWEPSLQALLRQLTSTRRMHLSESEKAGLDSQDKAEERWQQDSGSRVLALKKQELSGRISGTKEWREKRHESGSHHGGLETLQLVASGLFSLEQAALNGSARRHGAAIRLTDNVPGQTGSAFLTIPSNVTTFAVRFSFRMHKSGDGADGMAFIIQSAPTGKKSIGTGGCELGYGGISHSIAIELDTYRSQDTCDDPPAPHISLQTRGAQANEAHHRSSLWCTRPGSLPDIDNGQEYWMRVEVEDMKHIRIFLGDSEGSLCLTPEKLALPQFLRDKETVYVGWTASTGGLFQEHEVLGCQLYTAQ